MSKRGLQLHCKLQCYNVDFPHVDFVDFRLMPELKHNSGIRLCLVLSPFSLLLLPDPDSAGGFFKYFLPIVTIS